MTAPDYRPYLLTTDLRTPEDVLAWLRGLDEDDDAVPIATRDRRAKLDEPGATVTDWLMSLKSSNMYVIDAADLLAERLDRERRQACRRAARKHFKTVVAYIRWFPLASRNSHNHVCEAISGVRTPTESSATAWAVFEGPLALALAFRAAARAK